MTNARSAFWCYTWNNPNVDPDVHHESLRSLGCTFHIFQRERGENGTEHFQGYLECRSARTMASLKLANPQIHWEKRMGTQAQAIDYCKKDDSRVEGPWEYGKPRNYVQTGCSPDFVPAVRAGKRTRELIEEFPDEMRKYPRFKDLLREVFPPPVRDSAPSVVLLIGEPGTGKTKMVRDLEGLDLYVKPCDRDFWMNGYDLHPAVLLDDFAGASNHITLTNLLQLLDRYLIRVSTKNGHTWWQPERMYVTTNIHPANWYVYDDRMPHYAALERRFTKVIVFGEGGAVIIEKSNFSQQSLWQSFWSYAANHVERVTGSENLC